MGKQRPGPLMSFLYSPCQWGTDILNYHLSVDFQATLHLVSLSLALFFTLNQWFSTRNDFGHKGQLSMFGDIVIIIALHVGHRLQNLTWRVLVNALLWRPTYFPHLHQADLGAPQILIILFSHKEGNLIKLPFVINEDLVRCVKWSGGQCTAQIKSLKQNCSVSLAMFRGMTLMMTNASCQDRKSSRVRHRATWEWQISC